MARRNAAKIPTADGTLPAPVKEVKTDATPEAAGETAFIVMNIHDEDQFYPPITYVERVVVNERASFRNHQFNAHMIHEVPKHVAAAAITRWPSRLRLASAAEREEAVA